MNRIRLSLKWLVVACVSLAISSTACSADPAAEAQKKMAFEQAVCMGDTAKVKELLAAGADVNAKDEAGCTPLYQACRAMMGQKSVEVLLAAGADVNARDTQGKTPLYAAAESGGGQNVIKQLLAHKADPNLADEDGWTPLHMACVKNGWPETIRLLVEGGAKVNAANKDGRTPLHLAAEWDYPDAVKQLLELKADRDTRDSKGWTPLAVAARWAKWHAFLALRDAGAGELSWTPLHWAVIDENPEEIDRLVAAKADLNAKDRFGRTPLVWAASCHAEAAATKLIAAKADFQMADIDKRTPLLEAAWGSDIAILKALLAAGASVKDTDADGWTPLHFAADARFGEKCVAALLASKAEVDARTKKQETPLILAVDGRWTESAKLLLEAGADVEAVDAEGRSPESLCFGSHEIGAMLWSRLGPIKEARIERLLAQCQADPAAMQKLVRAPAATPQEALLKMSRSMVLGDRDAFIDCFAGSGEELKALETVLRWSQAGLAFRKAMLAAYGKDGWKEFQGDQGVLKFDVMDQDAVQRSTFTADGENAAVARLPGGNQTQKAVLLRSAGVWRIKASSFLGDVTNYAGACEMWNGMIQALEEEQARIGKTGVTPADLHEAVNRKFFKAMGFTFGKSD